MHEQDKQGWIWLGTIVSVIAIIWMIVLPRIGNVKSVRNRIDALEQQGIDPAALYYTDVEAMTRIEANVNAVRRSRPDAFWFVLTPSAVENTP